MTDRKKTKGGKLAHQILGLIGISAALAVVLFLVLTGIALVVAENYCFYNDVPMTEFDWMKVDAWIFSVSTAIAAVFFSLVFLGLLSDRMGYIRRLTRGIDNLGKADIQVPLEGNNELTELARTINEMSAAQARLREQEQALAREKEELIRSLSHDIRTPLTSILAYSELMAGDAALPPEKREQLQTIRKKAEQIRDLTEILLEGSRRNPETFADAKLLMEQLAAEFEEDLEDGFQVHTDLSGCGSFGATLDVQELRRVFGNLSSNVRKYADPAVPVELGIGLRDGALVICQRNAVLAGPRTQDSYKLGISSIRRIAQHYGGSVAVEEGKSFAITVTLGKINCNL